MAGEGNGSSPRRGGEDLHSIQSFVSTGSDAVFFDRANDSDADDTTSVQNFDYSDPQFEFGNSRSPDTGSTDGSVATTDEDETVCIMYKPALRWAAIGVIITLGCAAFYLLWEFEVIERFLVWLQGLPPIAGLAVFMPAFFLVSLPTGWGYVVLNLGAGYLWGLLLGQTIVMVSAAVGTLFATLLLRYACARWVEQYVLGNPQMASLLTVINGPQAFKLILLTRLTPIPYGVQNTVFSLVHMPMPYYMLATMLGCLPTQLLNTYFGTTLHSVEDVLRGGRMDPATTAVFGAQLVLGVLLMGVVGYAARREFAKHAHSRSRDVELQHLEEDDSNNST